MPSLPSIGRRQFLTSAVAAGGALAVPVLAAQGPASAAVAHGPLRLLVGFPPGGATDVMARLVAREMSGYPAILVDNRPGAGSRIAVEAAARAKPDGLTAVVTPDFSLTLMPNLYRKLGYDPLKDLAPVAMCATSETALSVGPAVPAQVTNVATFLDWARSHPQQALYASPSAGSTPHFTGILFSRAAKAELTHVSYKGGAQALQDLLGGQVPASFNPVGELLPHLGTSKLRVLATSGPTRAQFLPGVPTFSESGYTDVVVQSWLGVVVPAGTPDNAIAMMERSINEALQSKTVADGFAKFGLTVAKPVSRTRMAAILREDLQRWALVVKASGVVMEE